MPDLRACAVSYTDIALGRDHGGLFEAAVVGMTALKVAGWFGRSTLNIEVRVKQPETIHIVSSAVLTAWLARRRRTPSEVELKARLMRVGDQHVDRNAPTANPNCSIKRWISGLTSDTIGHMTTLRSNRRDATSES